jgi:hypothetical protein
MTFSSILWLTFKIVVLLVIAALMNSIWVGFTQSDTSPVQRPTVKKPRQRHHFYISDRPNERHRVYRCDCDQCAGLRLFK